MCNICVNMYVRPLYIVCMCMYVCACVCVHVCICVHVCNCVVYSYMYKNVHIGMHTYTFTCIVYVCKTLY